MKFYFDMDGVLADFNGQPNAMDRFIKEAGFFQKLEPTPLVERLNKMLAVSNENIFILSASPNKRADIDKTLWVYEHLPNFKPENIIIVRGGEGADERKGQYANEHSVLFDDYSNNLLVWESKGGKGVKVLNGVNGKGVKWVKETLDIVAEIVYN